MEGKVIDKTSVAWIAVTYNCNNQCKWCYSASNHLSEKKFLDSKYHEGISNLLGDLQTQRVILIGGEPTIYPYLTEIIDKLKKRVSQVGLITNGRRLRNKKYSTLLHKAGIEDLAVSIHGYNSESHDAVTQCPGSYDESIKGILTASEEGILVGSSTVISKESINHLEKIVDSLSSYVDNMSFNICGPCIGDQSNNNSITPLSQDINAFQKIYEYAEGKIKRIRLVTPTPLCLFDEEYRDEFIKHKVIHGGPCQISSGSNFVIDYNGDIVPCTHLTGFPILNIFKNGEVASTSEFIKEYNSPDAEEFRKIMSRYPSQKCTDCNLPCSGGCPLYWHAFKPDEIITGPIKIKNA